jgi:hypothetical protein
MQVKLLAACQHRCYISVMAENDAPSGKVRSGKARMEMLNPDERKALAKAAAKARWTKSRDTLISNADDSDEMVAGTLPEARFKGMLNLVGVELPVYVLENHQRVIGRTAVTEMLSGIKGGGALEKYLGVEALKPFISLDDLLERMVPFRLPEVEGLERQVKGLPADLVIDICKGFMTALECSYRSDYAGPKLTSRQAEMAVKAGMFVSACAKIGLDALIDEATGYQYERAEDALQVKLRAYLEEEMRAWEKTFPDELWKEFGRLTSWKGSVTQRPKYWGHLVRELVYEYLDPDVTSWLKENVPQPRHGRNWHQWLSSQYGLRKLVEHIWMVVGISKTCHNMAELKQKMAEQFGRVPVNLTLYLPPMAEPIQ